MASKLQNIKAIRQMLDGTHRRQTKTQIYTGTTKQEIPEEDILERFEDGKPRVWIETSLNGHRKRVTQHKGFQTRESESGHVIREALKDLMDVPKNCPECNRDMRLTERKLNFKFWFKRKKCFGCVLKEEQEIRQRGTNAWKEYEKSIIKANTESWFVDADKEVELLKQQVKETYWQNADGEQGQIDISDFLQRMEHDYEELKKEIRSKLE